MKTFRFLTIALFLSGCITTGDVQLKNEGSPREAAQTNLRLGSEYLKRGEQERAMEKLQRAVEQDPQLGQAHAYLGLIYEQRGQPEEAGRHYKTALRVDDDDANVRNMYGGYLCRNGRVDEAEKNFLAAAEVVTYRTPEAAYTNAGICVMNLPDLDRAEKNFRLALQRNPRYAEALWQMAKVSDLADRDFQARAFLQRLAEVTELSPEALWLGVAVERKLGDERAAAEYARKLRSTYPESVEARLLVESQGDDGSF